MRILLDTHVLLWALVQPKRLARAVQTKLADRSNIILFSAANIWEVAIKAALNRPDFRVDVYDVIDGARRTGYAELPVDITTAATVSKLPLHHRDPFDRLLIAQAMEQSAVLYTADRKLAAYGDCVHLI